MPKKASLQNVLFIINPASGINRSSKKVIRWIKKLFESHDKTVEIVYTSEPGEGTILAKQGVEKGFDMIVAVGGDGTINEVGSGLLNTEVVLGICPTGSGNGFARNFAIPLDRQKSLKLLLSPKILTIDAGQINDRYFFNVAGIGLDAEISKNFEQFGVRGPLPYFLVGTKSFLQYQINSVRLIMDDREIQLSPLLMSVANAPQYGNGAIIAPKAKPDDGLLDVCVLDSIPIWKAAPNLYRLFNGTIDEMEGFSTFQCQSLILERNIEGIIHTDGNPFQDGKILKVKVIPKALRVAVSNDSIF